MDFEKIALIAQGISFAYEDNFFDTKKRELFDAIFNRYLGEVDPTHSMEPYEAIIRLGRKNQDEFDRMIHELKKLSLIAD